MGRNIAAATKSKLAPNMRGWIPSSYRKPGTKIQKTLHCRRKQGSYGNQALTVSGHGGICPWFNSNRVKEASINGLGGEIQTR